MPRRAGLFLVALLAMLVPVAAKAGAGCAAPDGGLGVSRIVEIDTSTGPLYGDMTKYAREDSFLGPKEVVLTFDDGPLSWITQSILDTLDRYCTKATFFSVGQMALAYPQMVKEVLARGHTLGSHTWSHPMNLKHLQLAKAQDQIDRGFAAVSLAAGQPIAPFFRFPGLNDSDPLLAHLQSRGIASFTVDVVSNDSYIANPTRLAQRTLHEIEARQGGIVLFHDIKASTTKALPEILEQLKARGYKIVHMRAKTPLVPVAGYEAQLAPRLAKVLADAPKAEPPPSGDTPPKPAAIALASDIAVTSLAPSARQRAGGVTAAAQAPAEDTVQQHMWPLTSAALKSHRPVVASTLKPPRTAGKSSPVVRSRPQVVPTNGIFLYGN